MEPKWATNFRGSSWIKKCLNKSPISCAGTYVFCFAELSGEILVESAAVFSTVRAQEIKKREFRVSSIGCLGRRVSGVGSLVSDLGWVSGKSDANDLPAVF